MADATPPRFKTLEPAGMTEEQRQVAAAIVAPRLNELAILITAREWSAQFEWYAHQQLATKAGLSPEVTQAIAEGRRPPQLQRDEAIVYDFCTELLRTRNVSDATYQAALKAFGERGIVDLIGASGYYGLVSMVLNVARYPLPDGVAPPLKPLAR